MSSSSLRIGDYIANQVIHSMKELYKYFPVFSYTATRKNTQRFIIIKQYNKDPETLPLMPEEDSKNEMFFLRASHREQFGLPILSDFINKFRSKALDLRYCDKPVVQIIEHDAYGGGTLTFNDKDKIIQVGGTCETSEAEGIEKYDFELVKELIVQKQSVKHYTIIEEGDKNAPAWAQEAMEKMMFKKFTSWAESNESEVTNYLQEQRSRVDLIIQNL